MARLLELCDVHTNSLVATTAHEESLAALWLQYRSRLGELHQCVAALAKLTSEPGYLETSNPVFQDVLGRLVRMQETEDWNHPRVAAVLQSLQAVAARDRVPAQLVADIIGDEDARGRMRLSDKVDSYWEEILGNPRRSRVVFEAFREKIDLLAKDCAVTRLAFVESEAYGYSATPMMSWLVYRTGIPACVLRDVDRLGSSVTTTVLGNGVRVGLIYFFGGRRVIPRVADAIKLQTGATTVAAVGLREGSADSNTLTTDGGLSIRLESLDLSVVLAESIPERGDLSSRGEVQDWSAPREELREELDVLRKGSPGRVDRSGNIPPGTYTRESLPPISERARAMLAEIEHDSEKLKSITGAAVTRTGRGRSEGGLFKMTDRPKSTFRFTDKGSRSIFDARSK